MAFVVEDGTGLENANAYISVSYADGYFLDRNNKNWVGSTVEKQAAIIAATDYIELRFSNKFLGSKLYAFTGQMLSFPRGYLKDKSGQLVTGIPEKLKRATAEYAVRALSSPLIPNITFDDTGLQVINRIEQVGPLQEHLSYVNSAQEPRLIRPYLAADLLLQEYIFSGNSTYR